MANSFSVRSFDGLMNRDDAPEFVGQSEYIGAQNVRFGKRKRLEYIEGNRKIVNSSVNNSLTVRHYEVFSVKDIPKNRVIYGVWGSDGTNAIYMTDGVNCLVVLKQSNLASGVYFNFQEGVKIPAADVVGDFLFWSDGIGDPRKINIEACLKLNNPGYYTTTAPAVAPLNFWHISTIRKPPAVPLDFLKVTDATIPANMINGLAFRATWRYEYRDGELSRFAMQSPLIPHNGPGEQELNAVDIKVPFAEKVDFDVIAVELAIIFAGEEKPFIVKRWDKLNSEDAAAIDSHNSGTTQLTYRFTNNTVGQGVDAASITTYSDAVPRIAKAQTIADSRVFYGNFLIGYDTPKTTSMSIHLTSIENEQNATGYWRFMRITYIKDVQIVHEQELYVMYLPYDTPVFIKGYYFSELLYNESVSPGTVDISEPEWVGMGTDTAMIATIIWSALDIDVNDPGLIYDYANIYVSTMDQQNVTISNITITIGNSTSGDFVLKSGSPYRFGMQFYDKWMRVIGGVVTNSGLKITMPNRSYSDPSSFNSDLEWRVSNTSSTTEIPVDAYYYAPVRTKSLYADFFMQARVSEFRYARKNADGTFDYAAFAYDARHFGVALKIDLLQGYGMGYQFEEGDFIKLFFDGATGLPLVLPVIAADIDRVIVPLFDFSLYSVPSIKALFELFRNDNLPITGTFFEVGTLYSIINPKTDQRIYGTLEGSFKGDVIIKTRNDGTENYLTENMNPDDKAWKLWLTDTGRIAIVQQIGAIWKKNWVCFSNQFEPGTRNNGLCSFEALNQTQLPLDIGSISVLLVTNKSQEKGGVMLAIGSAGAELYSIYIGEAEVSDLQGSVYLAKSNSVIGGINKLRGSVGTDHPESVVSFGGLVFGLDVKRAKVWQYQQNGVLFVSDAKSSVFWEQWCQLYLLNGTAKAIPAGIDEYNNELLIALPEINTDDALSDTSFSYNLVDGSDSVQVFRFDVNRWQGQYKYGSYKPSGFVMRNNALMSFYNGDVYIHDNKEHCGLFYNSYANAWIIIAENAGNPASIKVWQNVKIVGSFAPDLLVFRTEMPFFQESQLESEDFRMVEGNYYAAIRRNVSTPGTPNDKAIINGERMRGNVLFIHIEFGGYSENIYMDGNLHINYLYTGYSLSKGQTV